MTYGVMLSSTRDYILARAAKENIPVEKLGLEPAWEECSACEGIDYDTCDAEDCEDGSIRPDFLREIAVIFGGALDETFYLDDLYCVNVADWLAEQCREQDHLNGGAYREHWEVIVTVPHPDDSTEVYRVSSEDME